MNRKAIEDWIIGAFTMACIAVIIAMSWWGWWRANERWDGLAERGIETIELRMAR